VFDQTTVDIDAKSGSEIFQFRVTGSVPKFDGFLRSMWSLRHQGRGRRRTEAQPAAVEAGQRLTLKSLLPEQHFTEPPRDLTKLRW